MTNAALRGKPDTGNPHVRFAVIFALILLPYLVVNAEKAATQEGSAAKPDVRYLALLGIMHSRSGRIQQDVDTIRRGLEGGAYGESLRTMHETVAQGDIDAFFKDVSVVLSSKTPDEAAPSLKAIEDLSDKMHKACAAGDASSCVWKIATLLGLSKDVQSPLVATSLLKRTEKIKSQGLMAIDKSNDKRTWSTVYEAKCCMSLGLLEAYRMGLGFYDMPESSVLLETMVFNWPGDDLTQPKVESAKCKKSVKLAESAIGIILAADGVVSAQVLGKGKSAIAALDKAVKMRVSIMLSANGPSKPTQEAMAQVKADCYKDYAALLEYLKGKSSIPAIQRELEATAGKAKKSAEKILQ